MVDGLAEWHIAESAYPRGGSEEDQLRFLVRYAILAPSGHNTQPWLFRVANGTLQLIADRTRALPVVDPHDRALLISNGAALALLCVAMRYFGRAGHVDLLPEPQDPDLLATVRLGPAVEPDQRDGARFHAIAKRRTTRKPFDPAPLEPSLLASLRDVGSGDAKVRLIDDPATKARIAELVGEGDRAQFADPAFRRELGAWVHSRRAASRDGMSGANFGMPDVLSAIGGLVIRTFDMGQGIAAKDADIAAHSPVLAAIITPGDTPRDWLDAGMAHALLLLDAAAAGLTAAYLNQPVEVDALRGRLAQAAAVAPDYPQLLLRIGKGPPVPPAVRRPVEEVLLG